MQQQPQQILLDLMNFDRIYDQMNIIPNPPLPELNGVWELNDTNGLPIFPDPLNPFIRYVPSTIRNTIFGDTLVGRSFIQGVERNIEHFDVNCGVAGMNKKSAKVSLLRMVYMGDVKKIHVNQDDEDPAIMHFHKIEQPLLPYDIHHPEEALRTSHTDELIIDINKNSRRGHLGPGTFWCRHPKCLITGPTITQTPVVQWGPNQNQVIYLRKRFKCDSSNIVYMIHCQACLNQGRWSMYIGQTGSEKNLHHRLKNHMGEFVDHGNKYRYPIDENFPAVVDGILNHGIEDPFVIARDTFIHFNYIHTHADRKDSILEGGFPNYETRLLHERFYQFQCGRYFYDPINNSGCLHRIVSS